MLWQAFGRWGGFAVPVLSGSAYFAASKTYTYTSGSTQTVSLTDLKDASNNSVTLLEGDYIVVTMSRTSTSDLAASAVSPSTSGYTIVASDLYGNDNWDANFAVNYKRMGSTPDTSVDLPGTGGGGMAVTIYALRGISSSTPLDVTATTASGGNTGFVNAPAITPITAGALITVHGGTASVASLPTAYGSPSDLSSTTNHFRMATIDGSGSGASTVGTGIKTNWTSGSFDPAEWDNGSSVDTAASWAAITIAWRPA